MKEFKSNINVMWDNVEDTHEDIKMFISLIYDICGRDSAEDVINSITSAISVSKNRIARLEGMKIINI